MTMKKIQIVLMIVAAALFTSCYNDFDTVEPEKIWTDSDFKDCELISINDLKKEFFMDKFGGLSNTGSNGSWSDTKSYQIDRDVYIKGKVISNDREGNIFKSLFLQDESGAIEIRLTNGNFLRYHMGIYNEARTEIPSQWVYVKLKGLYIGNYRMMLSIGNGPSESYNAVGEHKFYANSNIEQAAQIKAHVFPGEPATLVVGKDIKVITPENYLEALKCPEDFGRLIRFERIKCHYAGVKNQDGVQKAPLKNGQYDQIYPSWIYTDIRPIVNKAWYRMAYSHHSVNLFGSVCFTYNEDAQYTSDKGVYMVRTSGYSRFSDKPVVKDGRVGNITGIYGIYSKRSDFTGGSYDFATYQLSISHFMDLEFEADDFLTDAEVEAMTPADSYETPNVNELD